jgi:hypothetical protein
MNNEINRYTSPQTDRESQNPEIINSNEAKLAEAMRLVRTLSGKVILAVNTPERQRAFLDLIAVVDSQLQEELATVRDPHHKRSLRPADHQQLERAYRYFKSIPNLR